MAGKLKKFLPLIIAAVVIVVIAVIAVLASGGEPSAVVHFDHTGDAPVLGEQVKAQDDYVQVAESDTYRLYYYEPRLSIKLENKQTGVVLESTVSDEMDDGLNNKSWTGYMKSGIVINAIIGTVNTYQVDMNTCANRITTWYTDGGIYAQVYFDDYQFGLGVEVTLQDDELVVRVPESSIVEEKEGTYISTVSLFPFLGYTHLGDKEGYMLIPDGNGALITLDDKEGRYSTGFSRLIYGTDDGMTSRTKSSKLWERYETVTEANAVLAPVFGMAHTDEGIAYLGIVESGDERCSIECHPNGVMVAYNRCFAKFLLRDIYVQPLNKSASGTMPAVEKDRLHSDLQVRYCLLSGEDADYSGMARAYRSYLLDSGRITQQDLTYNTRIDLLGTEREEFLMGTKAVTMTTVEQAEAIFEQLRSEGVNNVLSVYRGWQKGGLYDVPISGYTADSHIGGTGDLTKLICRQAEQGYQVYLYNDALSVNRTTNPSTFNVMKMVNKRTFEKEVNGQVYDLFYYLMPERSAASLTGFAESCTDKGVNTVALAGITDTLFSYSSKGSFYSRTDTMDTYTDAVGRAAESLDLILESPNAYLWKYTGAMLDMPLGSSDYLYVDEEIPFLSMVLKGTVPMYAKYVNFEANKNRYFLQMVESGMYPSFYLTWEDSSQLIYTNSSNLYSLEYDSYRDTIVEYDTQLRALAEMTGDACIENHEVLKNGLVKVSYDNGVVIYVNYTETALSADGLTVDALSYKAGERA